MHIGNAIWSSDFYFYHLVHDLIHYDNFLESWHKSLMCAKLLMNNNPFSYLHNSRSAIDKVL